MLNRKNGSRPNQLNENRRRPERADEGAPRASTGIAAVTALPLYAVDVVDAT